MKQKNIDDTVTKAASSKKFNVKSKGSAIHSKAKVSKKIQKNIKEAQKILNSNKIDEVETKTEESADKTDATPTPEYQAPTFEETQKNLSFSKLVFNQEVINILEKSEFSVPSQNLFDILPSIMRGSHTLIYKPTQIEDFLIGCLPFFNSEKSEENQNIKNILFFSTKDAATTAFSFISKLFENLGFKYSVNSIEQDSQVLFITPDLFLEHYNNNAFDNSKVKFAYFYAVNELLENKSALIEVLKSLNKSQFVFISRKNTPQVRELAFSFLEDPEVISLLPNEITEQYPRQFAHALEATQKFQVLLGYLKTFRPRCALVIANTKTVAEWIAFKLHGNSIKVSLLTTPLSPQEKRTEYLNKINSGEINIIVTTDHILKNFSLENLHCIYHFDLPEDPNLYLLRVNKLIGARNPISIAFICEDYGYNMGKIENLLGFPVKLTRPDKNFFKFKDESDYPLMSDGRVKIFGEKIEKPSPIQEVSEKEIKTLPTKTLSETKSIEKEFVKQEPEQTHAKPKEFRTTPNHYQPDKSKFVRRDDRAREAVADALLAAKRAEEKRKEFQEEKKQKHSSQYTQKEESNVVGTVFSIVIESLKAGIHATKDSFMHHTEEKLPMLYKFFKRPKK